jgi:hypothetical protein
MTSIWTVLSVQLALLLLIRHRNEKKIEPKYSLEVCSGSFGFSAILNGSLGTPICPMYPLSCHNMRIPERCGVQ